MSKITIEKEEMKELIKSFVEEAIIKLVKSNDKLDNIKDKLFMIILIEYIKSKDENIIETIEDTLFGMIMENDKQNEKDDDFVDGEEFRKSLLDIMK